MRISLFLIVTSSLLGAGCAAAAPEIIYKEGSSSSEKDPGIVVPDLPTIDGGTSSNDGAAQPGTGDLFGDGFLATSDTLTSAMAQSWFTAGSSVTLGGAALVTRSRTCTNTSGCAAWKVRSRPMLLTTAGGQYAFELQSTGTGTVSASNNGSAISLVVRITDTASQSLTLSDYNVGQSSSGSAEYSVTAYGRYSYGASGLNETLTYSSTTSTTVGPFTTGSQESPRISRTGAYVYLRSAPASNYRDSSGNYIEYQSAIFALLKAGKVPQVDTSTGVAVVRY